MSSRLACLAGLCLAALLAGCQKKVQTVDLVVLTPHTDKIKDEFKRAFGEWHQQRHGAPAVIEWRSVGGGTQAKQFILQQYGQTDSSGMDIYWGGGDADHKLLAERGICVPVKLPDELLREIPATLAGIRQYDEQGRWYGTTLSCFGILYNAKLLRQNNLPIPRGWEDLATPAMFGRVAAARANLSSSACMAYEMLIQAEGDWQAGWATLLKFWANCKQFTNGASDVAGDVANGEVLAGAAIDFYAYTQIAVSGTNLGFVSVQGKTAFTPDPISVLKGAPHAEMAKRFVEFVLSAQGQALWCLPPGAPDGPKQYALYREPIRRDLYAKYEGKMLPVLQNPFNQAGDFKLNSEVAMVRVGHLLGPLMQAAAIDSQPHMVKAWKTIIAAGCPADLVKEFTALPADLSDEATALATARKLADAKEAERITSAWQRYFREKYERLAKAR